MDPSVELRIVPDHILAINITTAPMMGQSSSRLFSSLQVNRSKITHTCLMEIAGHCVFDKYNAVQFLNQLHNQGVVEFPVALTQEKQLYLKDVQQNINKASTQEKQSYLKDVQQNINEASNIK